MYQTNNIDINLYDRQVRTYGEEAVKKMTTSSVLIVGLEGGLATEIGKNLALGGIKNIYLCDTLNITEDDVKTGFYYSRNTIGQLRSEVLCQKLQELNPYISVQSVSCLKQNQDVTILINRDVSFIKYMSIFCRENNSKLVVLFSKGISGVVFVDAGDNHLITDTTGEIIEPVQIGGIASSGLVNCAPNTSHEFQSGDFITFQNVEGRNINFLINREWKIKIINKVTFQLEDFNYEDFTFINGTAIYIKKPIEISHKPFEEQIENPSMGFTLDLEHSNDLIQTYLKMFNSLGTFRVVDSLPFIWDQTIDNFMTTNQINLPEQARLFKYELIQVVSLMGSITASEVIKLVTNKYMPANQWFTWTDRNLIPKEKPVDYQSAETVFGILYGSEFENKLKNSSWLIVGSGAIGCELLKNLAYMSVACGENGKIIITDPDSIEKSNLNRQFLFRSQHIGRSKSETASDSIRHMNPNINIVAMTQKVGSENSDFTNGLMSSGLTGVLNALDNIKSRRFMDEQCFKFGIPLFESGTTGTKGNTQPVIPFLTETYSASSDPEQEKSFPICTIKSFPNEIQHTVHWAMDQFEFFNRAPSTMNKWIQNPNYLNDLGQIEKSIAMEDINLFSVKYQTQKTGLKGCALWAVDMFTENYHNSIAQLLYTFKPDHEVSPGIPFWSAGKRCPKTIKLDLDNNLHLDYIESTTHLLARISGIADQFSREELKQMVFDYQSQEFIPKEIQIASNDSELDKMDHQTKQFVIGNPIDYQPSYASQEFEKDDDSNWHINWINAVSNLRATNYGIPIVDRQQTKGIAGKIIPAIATTTSAVAGLILLETLKYMLNISDIQKYYSTFINLAEPILISSEPLKAPMIKIGNNNINSWTKFVYTKNTTLNEFKKYYEDMFDTEINMIVIGTAMVYADFLGSESLDKLLRDIISETLDGFHSNVFFTLGCEDDTKDLPTINVNLTIAK